MKHFFRHITLLLITLSLSSAALAQKLVLGSERPSLKGIEWQNGVTPKLDKAIFIEFYHHGNSSSRSNIDKLSQVEKLAQDNIEIIILTRDNEVSLTKLNELYGDRYIIGYDPTGAIFRSFGVKYIPYSMLINRKGHLVWIGNLQNFNSDILGKVL